MDYKNSKSEIAIRLDTGDEVLASIKEVCKKENITTAIVSGLGAASKVEIGHYDEKSGKYNIKKFEGALFEIISLSGNITLSDNEPLVHLHIAIGLDDFTTASGHLMSATVRPACEIVLQPMKTKIGRKFDEKSKLKVQEFY